MLSKIYTSINKILSFLILVQFLCSNISCESNNDVVIKSGIIVSEPLINRPIEKLDMTNPHPFRYKHNKDCYGFFYNHFNPIMIKSNHFTKKSLSDLNARTGIKWFIPSTNNDSIIDFTNLFDETNNKVVYVAELVNSDKEKNIILSAGSDDGLSVWLNGDSLGGTHAGRGLMLHDDLFLLRLIKGENILLYKVDQSSGGWALYRKYLPEKRLPGLLQTLTTKMYNDIPESCILPNTARHLPLKTDQRRKLDRWQTVRLSWKSIENEDSVIHRSSYRAAELPDSIPLPPEFTGTALVDAAIIFDDNSIRYREQFPVFFCSAANSLARYLTGEILAEMPVEIQNDAVTIARKEAVQRMFAKELDLHFETEKTYSTRMKLHTLLDLYRSVNGNAMPFRQHYGPNVMGYRSRVDSSIQTYRIFIPAPIQEGSKPAIGNKKYPMVFLLHHKHEEDTHFWENWDGFSHSLMTNRIKFSTARQVVIVTSHGRGIQNFRGKALEEIPIVIRKMTQQLPIDSTNISLLIWSSQAVNSLKMLQEQQRLPIATVGLNGPVLPAQQQELKQDLLNIKQKYPDLRWVIVNGTDDKNAPIAYSRRFARLLESIPFDVVFRELPHSTHWHALKDPENVFYGIIAGEAK